jgi:hypothetical protein
MTLRVLQSAANNKHIEAPMTWDAINQAGEEYGGPTIDYDRFAARWESDPILKQLVTRFDGHGVVIKTDAKEPKQMQGQPPKPGEVTKMAKRATDKAFK